MLGQGGAHELPERILRAALGVPAGPVQVGADDIGVYDQTRISAATPSARVSRSAMRIPSCAQCERVLC
jgi:hypothetical protein